MPSLFGWHLTWMALLGPDLIVEGTGSIDLHAGYLVSLWEGLTLQDGAVLQIIIDPSLLPP